MESKKIKNETLRKAYEGSYYTIVGAGGDQQEWKDDYAELLEEQSIGKITEWVAFTGKDMNDEFHLTGDIYPAYHTCDFCDLEEEEE